MSRWWRGEPVASQAQAYHRSPLEPLPGGADFPAPLVLQQRLNRLRAGQPGASGQGEHEVRRHPQHVRLACGFEVLAQLGAGAVYLVPAVEVRPDPAGGGVLADVDGQLALGAEYQVQRQPHEQGLRRVLEVLAGDPLPGADQRVPGPFPHVRQVHRVDPVGHPARAPQVLPFHARGGLAGLFLPGLVDRPDHQAAAPFPAPRRLLQAGHREPAHHAHRGQRVPDSRDSAAAGSYPASCPRHAGRCSTRSAPAARSSPRRRTCLPAATAQSWRNTAAAAPAAQPVSAAPARPLS